MYYLSGFSDEMGTDFEKGLQAFKDFGINYFELRSLWGKNILSLSDDEVKKAKRIADNLGLKNSAIASPIGKSNIEEDISYEMKRLERAIELSKIFGSKKIRIFSFYSSDDIYSKRDEVMERLSIFSSIAEKNGVVLLHENEAKIYGEKSRECFEIASTLKSNHFALVFDPANYSVGGEVVKDAENTMHDYISYIHIKDYSSKEKKMVYPGEGDSEIEYVLDRNKDKDMFISMEPHLSHAGQFGGETDYDSYKIAVEKVKNILLKIGAEWR